MSFHNQLKNHHFQSVSGYSTNADIFNKSYANMPYTSNHSIYSGKKETQRESDYHSEIESAIMKSNNPIEINEIDEINVLGQRGVWANKSESISWKGPHLLSEYSINNDPNPQIVFKKSQQPLEYIQELAIRYLKPPTPPTPGEIIIREEGVSMLPPAPPLIIRQKPLRPPTPEPLIIREVPPTPPKPLPKKLITISGKTLPPPPRKVVIERLAPLPSKPQSIIIERWLPYNPVKRKVVFHKIDNQTQEKVEHSKNVIIQWTSPDVKITKEFKYLGVIRANPLEYIERYGSNLKSSNELPEYVLDIKNPDGIELAAETKQDLKFELIGDLDALNLIDLEKEGLGMYKNFLKNNRVSRNDPDKQPNSFDQKNAEFNTENYFNQQQQSKSMASSFVGSNYNSELSTVLNSDHKATPSSVSPLLIESSLAEALESSIEQIFRLVDFNNTGRINAGDAEKTLLRLNSRLKRSHNEDEVIKFFETLQIVDGSIDLNEFKRAFLNLAMA